MIKYRILLYLIYISLSSVIAISVIRADYQDPTIKVNQNKQTDLFEESTGNWSDMQDSINKQKESALDLGKSQLHLDSTVPGGRDAINNEASNLSNIKATDLNARGTDLMIKEKVLDEIYVDYTKPLNKQSLKDAEVIAEAQEGLMGNLLGKLKEIGVDCKTVKGNKEQDPAYYLQMNNSSYQDTEYDKKICEDLRNSYNCTDSLSMRCMRRGTAYKEWQDRVIRFNGRILHDHKMAWGYAVKWRRGRWGWIISPHHPRGWGDYQIDSVWRHNPAAIIADARLYIAQNLGVDIEQIGTDIRFPIDGRGMGAINEGFPRWRVVWDEYEFGYKYRDAYEICEDWREEWTERCNIDGTVRSVDNLRKRGKR